MNKKEHLLTILSEESVEVALEMLQGLLQFVQRITKALRFGINEVQEGQDRTNLDRLRQEFAEILAVYEMLGFEAPNREAIEAKKLRVEKYLQLSKEQGTLTTEEEVASPTPITTKNRNHRPSHGGYPSPSSLTLAPVLGSTWDEPCPYHPKGLHTDDHNPFMGSCKHCGAIRVF